MSILIEKIKKKKTKTAVSLCKFEHRASFCRMKVNLMTELNCKAITEPVSLYPSSCEWCFYLVTTLDSSLLLYLGFPECPQIDDSELIYL